MRKRWFKRKLYGWGWTFGTWESFVVIAFYGVANVFTFVAIDKHSHSGSDTLINFAPMFLMLTALLYLVCYWRGEKPRWQWGKRIESAEDVILRGGIVVMPTDTTYGIVGSALNERAVHEIYRLRKRDLNKPFIVLIADKRDLQKFGVVPTKEQNKVLNRVWPGPVSVILPCVHEKFAYLHRGKNTLAFRLPQKPNLRRLLRQTGPLVAPSANPQGLPIAKTLSEAHAYFGQQARPVRGHEGSQRVFDSNGVDFYQDGGTITASPSHLIDITDGTEKVLR